MWLTSIIGWIYNIWFFYADVDRIDHVSVEFYNTIHKTLLCKLDELSDGTLYPRLTDVVSLYMMHGSCGYARHKSPRMKDGRFSKYYPKRFQETATIDEDG